jgi:hypothetical protein
MAQGRAWIDLTDLMGANPERRSAGDAALRGEWERSHARRAGD